eukprot:5624878-Prymnesium_polylepis.2
MNSHETRCGCPARAAGGGRAFAPRGGRPRLPRRHRHPCHHHRRRQYPARVPARAARPRRRGRRDRSSARRLPSRARREP